MIYLPQSYPDSDAEYYVTYKYVECFGYVGLYRTESFLGRSK